MPPSVCGFFLVEKKTVTDDNHRVGLAIRSKQSALIIPVDFTRSQLRFFFAPYCEIKWTIKFSTKQ